MGDTTSDATVGGTSVVARASGFARGCGEQITTAEVATRSAAAGFWLFISVIPALLTIVNVLGLVLDQSEVADGLSTLTAFLPGTLGEVVAQRLAMIAAPSPGTGLADTLLVLTSVWTVSAGFHALLSGIAAIYSVPRRTLIVRRGISVVVAVVALAGLAVITAVVWAADRMRGPLTSLVTAVILVLVIVVLYRIGSRGRAPWRFSVLGAMVAAAGLLIVFEVLRLYTEFAPTMASVYGTAAGVVAAMLTAWLSAFVIFLGAVVNVQWSAGRGGRRNDDGVS